MTNIERAKKYLDLVIPSKEYQKRCAMASMLGFSDIAERLKANYKRYLWETSGSSMHAYLNTDDYAEYLERIDRANILRVDDNYFNQVYVYHVGLSRNLLYQNNHRVNLIFDYKIITESLSTSFYSVGFTFNPNALDALNPSYRKSFKDEYYYDKTNQIIDSRNSTLFYDAYTTMRHKLHRSFSSETCTFHLRGSDYIHAHSFARLYGVERYRNGVLVSVCLKRAELYNIFDRFEPNLIIYFEFDSKYNERFYETRNVFNNEMAGRKFYLDDSFIIYL